MASTSKAATNEQRQRDLELLKLSDPDCPQDLFTYESTYSFSSINLAQEPSSSNEFPAMNENETVDASNWTMTLSDETYAYIDAIIAADEASRSSGPCVADPMFTFPRKYKCPMCPKEFLSEIAMRKHGRRHVLKQIKCHCGFRGQSPVQKHKHYLYHHIGMPMQKFLASF